MRPFDKQTACKYFSWIFSILGLLFVLNFQLVSALISGLLVFELVQTFSPWFARHLSTHRAKGIAIGFVILCVVAIIFAAIFGIILFMKSEGGSLPLLFAKMADILEATRKELPPWMDDYLPSSAEVLSARLGTWLRAHASEVQEFGKHTGEVIVHLVIGTIIGAMVSLHENLHSDAPLANALIERIALLGKAFRRVVFAQIRISALNTVFSAIYLAIILPLCGVSLPLVKTMIVVTFLAGLLPVVGNLISNTVIFIVSMAHSPFIAISSLSYLIIIHKLEYFLNARIVGARIQAKAWELLCAMLVMESAFGIAGLVVAPIAYAWLKDELIQRELI